MTVRDLINKLLKVDDLNRTVILQKDVEGNAYSPLCDWSHGWYEPESTWSGELVHCDDVKNGEVELSDRAVKAVVLVPVN